MDKEKGYWCVSLREGQVIATGSGEPAGDFNIRLTPVQAVLFLKSSQAMCLNLYPIMFAFGLLPRVIFKNF
ncbi:MAG: hypothetical protein ABFD08_16620 [Syntrophomonas sp.]